MSASLNALIRQDARAFTAFVSEHERAVFALLSRFLGRSPHVEDLAQETFLRAYRALPGFDLEGSAKLSTWLLTIAARAAIDFKRKKSPQAGERDDVQDLAADSNTPERETGRRELGRQLEEAAATLSDEQRIILLLSDMHDLSLAEIAQAVEAPIGTVKTRLFRAREKMRNALTDLQRSQ